MLYPWVKSKIDTPIAAPLKQISFFEKVSDMIDAKSPALDADMIPFISAPESNIKGNFTLNFRYNFIVFTKSEQVKKYLTCENYEFTEDAALADVVWLSEPIYNFSKFFDENPARLVSSFPFEYLMIVPAYLSELVKYERDLDDEQSPSWFATTYDMLTEFDSFVACQLAKEKKWTLHYDKQACVSSSLNEIIRMTETKKPILIKWIPEKPLCADVHVQLRILFLINSLTPIEVSCVDMVEVRSRKFTAYGQVDQSISVAISDDFSSIESLQSGCFDF